MKWTKELEGELLAKRSNGSTYKAIASKMGLSISSVKHKVRRLQQSNNLDKYKHTQEKTNIAKATIVRDGRDLNILETHCGFGGMTEFYAELGCVEGYDICKDRVDSVNALGFERVQAIKGDSEKEIIRLLSMRCTYDVVDIDPYGMPSRYFPHAFGLINDGIMFVTLPMVGVAQMNKITIRHLNAFWGVDYKDKSSYVDRVIGRMRDYAFMHKREIDVIRVDKIDRIFRISLKVKKRSLCEIVGLTVNRAI
ncbi:MAG: hypothetical protein GY928_11415 [Colwellia sp.]|nr:hypothetical protein [Colwellia sp.]